MVTAQGLHSGLRIQQTSGWRGFDPTGILRALRSLAAVVHLALAVAALELALTAAELLQRTLPLVA